MVAFRLRCARRFLGLTGRSGRRQSSADAWPSQARALSTQFGPTGIERRARSSTRRFRLPAGRVLSPRSCRQQSLPETLAGPGSAWVVLSFGAGEIRAASARIVRCRSCWALAPLLARAASCRRARLAVPLGCEFEPVLLIYIVLRYTSRLVEVRCSKAGAARIVALLSRRLPNRATARPSMG